MNAKALSAAEKRVALSLSFVFFLRMLGLFILLPVLALAGGAYHDATPQLLGLALGIYGLTQAGLQIPFGMLSDRYGRKPIIVLGLAIFIAGSLLAALADSVYGLILGRALQGAGAVAAAIIALAADLSSEQARTRVMALIGISIGFAFCVAFVLGPLLYAAIGLAGLFYLGAALGGLAILILLLAVPTPRAPAVGGAGPGGHWRDLKAVLTHGGLLRLNYSIFSSHLILMANFVVIPVALRDYAGLQTAAHWRLYLAVLFLSLFIMAPFIMFSERRHKTRLCFILGIVLILLAQAGLLFFHAGYLIIALWLTLFFGAFNYLEAFLPSEVSRRVVPDKKGAALGLYSTAQFIGIFIGGLAGGLLHQRLGIGAVHLFCLLMALFWLLIIVLPGGQPAAGKDQPAASGRY